MGFLHLINKDWKVADNVLHFLVSAALVVSQIIILTNHGAADSLVSGLSAGALGVSSVLAVYHLGLSIQQWCLPESKETLAGQHLRNLLTALAVVSVGTNYGKMLQLGVATDDINRQLTLAAGIGLVAMRVLDQLLDHESASGTVTVKCPGPDEPTIPQTVFNTRILMTHILLLGSASLGWIHINLDSTKHSSYSDDDKLLLLLTTILITVHLALYPLVAILKLLKADWAIVYCLAGAKQSECKDTTLESLNRVPLIRTVVSTAVLAGLAVSVGHALGVMKAQLLIASLALYTSADAVGRNFV